MKDIKTMFNIFAAYIGMALILTDFVFPTWWGPTSCSKIMEYQSHYLFGNFDFPNINKLITQFQRLPVELKHCI